MANNLKDITVDLVSFVDRAAVRDPQRKSEPRKFLLYKSERAVDPDTSSKGDDMPAGTTEVEQAQLDYEAALNEAAEVAKAAGVPADVIAKMGAQGDGPPAGDDPKKKDDHDAADGKKPAPKGEVDGNADLNKADLSPDMRALIEKAEARGEERVAKAEREAREATSIAKAERDLRVEREFVTKAEGFESLPADATTLGPVLKRASEKLEKSDYDYLEGLLKSADEAINQGGLFAEVGRGGSPESGGGDAYGQLNKAAEAIMKSDTKMTHGDALAKAMRDNPELERQYLLEERGSVR